MKTSLLVQFSLLFPTLVTVAGAAQDEFQARCASFARDIDLPGVNVAFIHYVAGGTNTSLIGNPPSCDTNTEAVYGGSNVTSQLVYGDLCRVAMIVATSNHSEMRMDAWFPREYNGRFLATGNSGVAGCIQYYDLAYGARLGFATVGTNNGHNGMTGKPFYHHPDVLEDFVYRALHTSVIVGKKLTVRFYQKGFHKSYYLGCSTGGRQGFKSVEKYPNDFDGVVVGAPAINYLNLLGWSMRFYTITGPPSADTFLTPLQWKLIHKEILRQCDGLDGAEDGLIEDPDLCHPILETLICPPHNSYNSSNSTNCLNSTHVRTAQRVLTPLYSTNGTLLFPRMQPGSELLASGPGGFYSGTPFIYGVDWYRYVTLNDPLWSPSNWTLRIAEKVTEQNPFNAQTLEPDLSAFRAHGGRILHYHGLEDQLISSENSKHFYSMVSHTMQLPPSSLDEFYRFFTISGMGHCGNGAGAYGIGQALATYDGSDPEDNVLMAMVKWVEEGKPPDTVRGAKFAHGAGSNVEYRRRHCRYPRRNVYRGPGKSTDENSWYCV